MPVSIATARDPFRGGGVPAKLRTSHARVLAVLAPADPAAPQFDWPLFARSRLGTAAGYTATSGSLTRALDGIARVGSKMGAAHPGLLALGYVETVVLDVEGVRETCYRATAAGVTAYRAHIAVAGVTEPVKDAATCTNRRYARS